MNTHNSSAPKVVFSAKAHTEIEVTVDGKPARLAVITEDGTIVASGPSVARAAGETTVQKYRDFLIQKGYLRILKVEDLCR